jgi:hypothetical protein
MACPLRTIKTLNTLIALVQKEAPACVAVATGARGKEVKGEKVVFSFTLILRKFHF